MKYLKSYTKFTEALLPSQFRKYMKNWDSLKKRYDDIFKKFKDKYDGDKNAYRIYLPYKGEVVKSEIETDIEKLLDKNGWEIIDYVLGQGRFKGARNPKRIGQILTSIESRSTDTSEKEEAKRLMKAFVEDPIRKAGSDLLVCISRHPYDIAGADTDRTWTNCMTIGNTESKRVEKLQLEIEELKNKLKLILTKPQNSDIDSKINPSFEFGKPKQNNEEKRKIKEEIEELQLKIEGIKDDGQNVRYLIQDVKEGSLIAFLIKNTDKNINNPTANLNIKPFINAMDQNDIILQADSRMYGQGTNEFKKIVEDWVEEFNGIKNNGLYCLNQNLYQDTDILGAHVSKGDILENIKKIISGDENISFYLAHYILEYLKNKCYNIDVNKDEETEEEVSSTVDVLTDDNEESVDKYLSFIFKTIDVPKFISLIDVSKLYDEFTKKDNPETEWVINTLILLSDNTEFTSQMLSYFDFDWFDDDIFKIFDRTNDSDMITVLNTKYNLIDTFLLNDDFESLKKLLITLNIEFKVSEKGDDFELKCDLGKYKFDNKSLYKKLKNLHK